jgi:hypothetical protein
MKTTKFLLFTLSVAFCMTLIFPEISNAQRRDYFTDEEIELIRDANEIDLRINVLVKAIDRRFSVINNDNSQEKQTKKDSAKWGELPTGTRLQLFSDIANILQKAIDDLEDLAARQSMNEKLLKNTGDSDEDQENARVLRTNNKKFPLAVHNLADASRKFEPMLEAALENTTDEREKGAILRALESCNLVIEGSSQIAKPASNKKNKKRN